MKVVIAPDSFKGTLRATQVCRIWREAFAGVAPTVELVALPLSDGGEGSLEAVHASTGAELMECQVRDALMRPRTAQFAIFGDRKESAFIETAAACGLEHLAPTDRNPMLASSYGAGELIAAALAAGVRHITVAIGGSATVDGGLGMLQALGFQVLDHQGRPLPPGGQALQALATIDSSQVNPLLEKVDFTIASDVTNPLLGPNGAATIFGPQKGATPEMVRLLEMGLSHFAQVTRSCGFAQDCSQPGDGAAGGLGFALRAFLHAQTQSGAALIAHLARLEEHLEGASYLITGEGKSDAQTLFGKLPAYVAEVARQHGVPTILCSGAIEDAHQLQGHFQALFSTVQAVQPLATVLEHASANLAITASSIAQLLQGRTP